MLVAANLPNYLGIGSIFMAQIFISHSSNDANLVDKFVDLLETGLGVRGEETIFASSIPGKDISLGNVNGYVKNELIGADLAIFILSSNFFDSPYCMAEMGAAWATDRKTFVFTVPPLGRDGVKAVFDGLQIEQLQTKKSLDKLAGIVSKNGTDRVDPGLARWNLKRDHFIKWLKSEYEPTPAPRQRRVEDQPEWRDRGHWSESIVDGTLYIGGSGYVRLDAKREIISTIKRGRVLPTIYSYLTNAGYHNWLRLTEDQSYDYYADSLKLFTEHDKSLATKIKGALNRDDIDMISLGPGDGRKDVVLLKALEKVFGVSDLYYYPFDVNPSMISHAMTAAGSQRRLKKMKVKAILADFDSLPEFSGIYQYRDAPNLLSLLGNTLGNLPDDRGFLEQIYSGAMVRGDLLLLEVRKSQASDSTLRTEANMEFDFGPLEMLGIPFELEKLHYKAVDGYSLVPNTKTVMATYDAMEYEDKEHTNVKLGLIREYDPIALKDTCEDIGFKVISEPEHRSAAALLLQK